jgi:hypothetical protein
METTENPLLIGILQAAGKKSILDDVGISFRQRCRCWPCRLVAVTSCRISSFLRGSLRLVIHRFPACLHDLRGLGFARIG